MLSGQLWYCSLWSAVHLLFLLYRAVRGQRTLSPHSHGLLVSLPSLYILALYQSDLYARSKGVAVLSPDSVQRSGSPRPLHSPHYLGGVLGTLFLIPAIER